MDESKIDNFQNSSSSLFDVHFFEKATEKSSKFLNNIWIKSPHEEKVDIDNEDEIVNNLEEGEFLEGENDFQNEHLGLKDSLTSYDSPKEDAEFTDDDSDATDYFDSDDEYQLSCNRRLMKDTNSLYAYENFDHYSTSHAEGRYSQGVEQYMNMPIFMRSIRKFANDNNFEIWNGKADGSCMFRSLADQLAINGHFGHTAESLRHTAVRYLSEHPLQDDGCPKESFLNTETMVEYLTRMSNPTEWSDHIMLKATVDALHLEAVVFNIYKDDIQRTEIKSSRKDIPFRQLTVYLGHLGEFHYVSLRPQKWLEIWPFRALLQRSLFHADQTTPKNLSEEKMKWLKNAKIKDIIQDTGLEELLKEISLGTEQMNGEGKGNSKPPIQVEGTYFSLFNSYGLDELQSGETNDSFACLIEDPLYVDGLTGIPLSHLGIIIRYTFPKEIIIRCSTLSNPIKINKQMFQFIGTFATGNNVALKDLSLERKKYFHQLKAMNIYPSVVAVRFDKFIKFGAAGPSQSDSKLILYADCSTTHPGYCWLRSAETPSSFATKRVKELNDGLFLTKQDLPKETILPPNTRKCCVGFVCKIFPVVAKEWIQRKRKFNWPPFFIIDEILSIGSCTLIPKCHPKSDHPDIEWKLDFSMANTIIFSKALSTFQIYGFNILKIVVQEVLIHQPKGLKNKHILSIFLRACEEIPQEKWESNLGGCILYSWSLLIRYLKRKFLPHYYISSNNTIDYYSDEDIETICVYMEAIRFFPAIAISFIAERHGYGFSWNLNKHVLSNCNEFAISRDLQNEYQRSFTSAALRVSKFFSRLGYYKSAFRMIREVYEETLLLPLVKREKHIIRPSFSEFFIKALKEFKQTVSRGILLRLFDMEYETDILTRHSKKSCKTIGDVIPWKVDFKLSWIGIPLECTRDFSSIASFLYDLSFSQYRKENISVATLAIDTAILCLCRAISTESLDIAEVEDTKLQMEIMTQQKTMKQNLKSTLFNYYIHVYNISTMNGTMNPIFPYMTAIEELSKEFPEMYEVVADMFFYVGKHDKGREYQRKFDEHFSGKTVDSLKFH
ncbi:uncharacterized protein LOC133195125 [Saccostrea echinata]|uniref:uncharacterized protein LOC133195125 n=1 Tax=Saccostrea echinata TaxID=191078 RepID=UPI002A804DA5|nr:uncharacterized protein LOC133195125 [Saccostrea echinata]